MRRMRLSLTRTHEWDWGSSNLKKQTVPKKANSPQDIKRRLMHRELSHLADQIQECTDEELTKRMTKRFDHLRRTISEMDKKEGS